MTDANLKAFIDKMKADNIDYYIITSSDPHMSEYVCDHFKAIEFLTGFTGESATLVISESETGLWVDGRYFIQAELEIEGTGVTLMRMGEEGVPTVEEYLKDNLKSGNVLGYDGRMISVKAHNEYEEIADEAEALLNVFSDPLPDIWLDRPTLPGQDVWLLADEYAGESAASKIARLREALSESKCNSTVICDLTEIAWLLNMRGSDVANTPVFMSYFVLTPERAYLYALTDAFDMSCRDYLSKLGVELRAYEDIYDDIRVGLGLKDTLIDEAKVNISLATGVGSSIVYGSDPVIQFKAVKNDTEIENTKIAHIIDGVAVTKFIHYIKTHIGKEEITELSAAEVLLDLRKQGEGFLDLSFPTIAAYGPNAAMMHYSATEESYSVVEPKGFLLVDSGGHYLTGTTDITRTIAVGELTEEQKRAYTMSLRAHLRLMAARFPDGVCGYNLDVLSRSVLWEEGLDYRCGTGHGVGHILSVHEGPNAFRWRARSMDDLKPLKPGMITTDEPGLYVEDGYGIRIENELLCKESVKSEYGQFYELENLTFAPYEPEAIIPEMLTQYEKETLNAYNKAVYEKLSPYLDEDEREWLKTQMVEAF